MLSLGPWRPMSAPPGYLAAQAAVARGPLLFSGALSEGQFYSPPESFAGEGWCVGELLSGRGLVRNGVGWVCSFYSFYQAPWGKPTTLSHTLLSPTSLHSHTRTPLPPHTLPTPCHCHLCLFSAGSDNESDEEVAGKKSFSAQVFACLSPTPALGMGAWRRASAGVTRGGQGFPSRG